MSKSNFSEDFKLDAMRQITDRGYPVAEVSQRLGVSQHSLYEWKKKFVASNAKGNDDAEEIRRVKKELARVAEGHDIHCETTPDGKDLAVADILARHQARGLVQHRLIFNRL